MLLVIFGAGASHGSADNGTMRPPLAEQLLTYGTVAEQYPGSMTVIDYVQRVMAENAIPFEDALARFGEQAERRTFRQQHLIAFRFYLCDVIRTVSNAWISSTHGKTRYLTLLNYLLDWQEETNEPIRLVTFNYDTLLENAISNVFPEWRFNSFPSYLAGPKWSLLKLHGSVTWARRVDADTRLQGPNFDRAIAAANSFARSDIGFEIRDPLAASAPESQSAVAPALAVPMTGKMDFECPREHVAALTSWIPDVTRVRVCGWRAAEEHMVEVLNGISPGYLLGVVSGSQDDLVEVHDRLGLAGERGKPALDEPNGMKALVDNLPNQLRHLLAP